jgi:hypothetical protein
VIVKGISINVAEIPRLVHAEDHGF